MTFDQWKDKLQAALDASGGGDAMDFDEKYLAWAFGEEQNPAMVAKAYIRPAAGSASKSRLKAPASAMGLSMVYVVGVGCAYIFWLLAVVNLFMAAADSGKMSSANPLGDAAGKFVMTYAIGGTCALVFLGFITFTIGQGAREYVHQASG